MSMLNVVVSTVDELIGYLNLLHPETRLLSHEPDNHGVQIVMQQGGGLLFTSPRVISSESTHILPPPDSVFQYIDYTA